MGKQREKSKRNSGNRKNQENGLAKSQNNEIRQQKSLTIFERGIRTSADLADLSVAAVQDNLEGAVSVGQGNLILRMISGLLRIKQMELRLAGSETPPREPPRPNKGFLLPGN